MAKNMRLSARIANAKKERGEGREKVEKTERKKGGRIETSALGGGRKKGRKNNCVLLPGSRRDLLRSRFNEKIKKTSVLLKRPSRAKTRKRKTAIW